MEDISIHVRHDDTVERPLHSKDLVRPHRQKDRLRVLDDEILVQHLREMEFGQELVREVDQLVDADVVLVRPEERQRLQDVLLIAEQVVLIDVRAVFGHGGIGNHKNLNKSLLYFRIENYL